MSFGYTNRLDNPIHSTVYQLFMLRNLKTSVIGKYPKHLLGAREHRRSGAGNRTSHANTVQSRVKVRDAHVVHKRSRDGHRPRDSRRTVVGNNTISEERLGIRHGEVVYVAREVGGIG